MQRSEDAGVHCGEILINELGDVFGHLLYRLHGILHEMNSRGLERVEEVADFYRQPHLCCLRART